MLSPIFALSAAVAIAAEAPSGTSSLQRALSDATLIVFGQVVRVDTRAGRSIVTMRIEHVARGTATESVSYYAEQIPFLPVIEQYWWPAMQHRVGTRALAFLEPSGEQDPPLKIGLNGRAVIGRFKRAGRSYLAPVEKRTPEPFAQLDLPAELCHGLDCSVELNEVLAACKLPQMPAIPSRAASYRVQTSRCKACSLPQTLGALLPKGAIRCPVAHAAAAACISKALSDHQPFKSYRQSDHALYSDGSETYALVSNPYARSNEPCFGRVVRRRCAAVDLHDEGGSRIGCTPSGVDEVMCSPEDLRFFELSPPRDVAALRCRQRKADGSYHACVVDDAPQRRRYIPPRRGPSLVCTSECDTPGTINSERSLSCSPE